MLNFIYYPVSIVLWCWHELFGFVLGDSSVAGWVLAIVFLVFTVRAILLKPAIDQMRSMRRMRDLAPQVEAIRMRYRDDRQRQAEETRRLQREHGVSPLAGCLPVLLQVPVFLGLTHVLRSFATYPHRPNYFFPLADVHSYLSAHLLGAHLGDAMVNIGFLTGHVASHALVLWHVAPVAIPLMIAAAVATHVNARLSLRRSAQPGTWLAGTLAVWVFPLGALVFGGLLPVGLLVYWVSNNVWTLVQQHLVTARLDRENHRPRAEPT